jgi:hypothetical protein
MDDDDIGDYRPGQSDAAETAETPAADGTGWPQADRPPAVPRPETGEPRVDAVLSALDDLTELPVAEHPAVFERVHAQLSEVLGELSSGAMTGLPGRDGN